MNKHPFSTKCRFWVVAQLVIVLFAFVFHSFFFTLLTDIVPSRQTRTEGQQCKCRKSLIVFGILMFNSKINAPVFQQIWRELFSPLHALNFGIAGDTTCNVLWRLQNGELENIRPKVRQRDSFVPLK